jgi:SAM-dependent methyltransferase
MPREPTSVNAQPIAGRSSFDCNICAHANHCDPSTLGREDASCAGCGSSVRLRAVVHLLSKSLFGESLPLKDFPKRPDLVGFGLSDWSMYAHELSRRLRYINTFYHVAPRLDITCVPEVLAGTADFLIASDVFEHVLPPVEVAFQGARRLLKDGGVFVFSVPFDTRDGGTLEHFPHIHDFRVEKGSDGEYRLHNCRRDGVEESFGGLVFHGGPGSTLEMRVFTLRDILGHFRNAGFTDVHVDGEPEPRWGIYWTSPCSLPLVARA